MQASRTVAALVGIVLVAASCSSGGGGDRSTVDAAVQPAPVDQVVVAVPAALQFTAPAVGGGEIDATSFAGKPTVFWFWAPT